MKNVLFIAYYFPPMAGAGVQRSVKFVKYMRDFGYDPIILTVDSKFTNWVIDCTLLSEIPKTVKIFRTPTFDWRWVFKILWGFRLNKLVEIIQTRFLIPDPEITWLPFARMQLKRIFENHRIDLVYITAGPFASLLLGPYIKKRYHTDYVVDFRDEWTSNPYRNDVRHPKRIIDKNRKLEHDVVSNCSGIVYTLPKYMKESFESSYPFLAQMPWKIIPNGFDESDFTTAETARGDSEDKFTLTYIGTFYGRRQPGLLWQALDNLIKTELIDPAKIKIKIIGKNTANFVLGEYVNDQTLNTIVNLQPNLSYHKALAELMTASALLLYVAPGTNSQAEITGKIFEYLRSYKPVLALVPTGGAAADILRKAGTGLIYDSSDVEEVKKGLLELYKMWQEGRLKVTPDKNYIAQYNRKVLTQQLADLFDEVLALPGSSGKHE